jgi:hypothetical protein
MVSIAMEVTVMWVGEGLPVLLALGRVCAKTDFPKDFSLPIRSIIGAWVIAGLELLFLVTGGSVVLGWMLSVLGMGLWLLSLAHNRLLLFLEGSVGKDPLEVFPCCFFKGREIGGLEVGGERGLVADGDKFGAEADDVLFRGGFGTDAHPVIFEFPQLPSERGRIFGD